MFNIVFFVDGSASAHTRAYRCRIYLRVLTTKCSLVWSLNELVVCHVMSQFFKAAKQMTLHKPPTRERVIRNQ